MFYLQHLAALRHVIFIKELLSIWAFEPAEFDIITVADNGVYNFVQHDAQLEQISTAIFAKRLMKLIEKKLALTFGKFYFC